MNPAQERKPVDFQRDIQDWARELGFSAEQAKAEVDKWVEEAKQKRDPYERGLAEFVNKNFSKARPLLREGAELKLQELAALREKTLRVLEETVNRFRKTGDAAYSDYDFNGALTEYERALTVFQQTQLPRLWAEVHIDIATANWAIGIRTEGPAVQEHLTRAKQAYDKAEQAYEILENRQGIATARVGKGNVFQALGIRTAGAKGQQLLADAVAAYRAALEVRTKESLPPQWAQTHNNLAEVSMALEDWEQAVTSYRNVLTIYPDYADAYLNSNAVLHEKLHAYAESFALNRKWLEGHPNDASAQSNFAEAHFTTGRFPEAEHRLAKLLADPELGQQSRIALRIIQIGTLAAQDKVDAIPDTLTALREVLNDQPEDFTLTWNFEGTKYFISQHEALAPSRDWLLDLIAGFEGKDRGTMLAAVETAGTHFMAAASP